MDQVLLFNLLQKMVGVGMMSNIKFNKFESKSTLAINFAKRVKSILEKSIALKNSTTILLSGGNTPKLFFNTLSQEEIDWSKVTIGLVDERWLPSRNKDSNENLIKSNLQINNASNSKFIPMYFYEYDLIKAQNECSITYKKYFQKCDVLVLGMGNDGHTASLFPECENLNEAYDLNNKNFCIAMQPKNAPYTRMSLTLSSILEAKNIFLHIEGEEKLKIFDEAMNDCNKYPISKVLCNDKKEVEVYFA